MLDWRRMGSEEMLVGMGGCGFRCEGSESLKVLLGIYCL